MCVYMCIYMFLFVVYCCLLLLSIHLYIYMYIYIYIYIYLYIIYIYIHTYTGGNLDFSKQKQFATKNVAYVSNRHAVNSDLSPFRERRDNV